jgi:hypothetical protein
MNAFRSRNLHINLLDLSSRAISQRGVVFGAMIIGALLAFEVFNYSTTQFALGDVLGDLSFAGIRWATILAIAFCGIDFAGLARLFTPEQGADEPAEVWYLFGAWLLAAAMNATLTWWGVSVAIVNHSSLGSAVVSNSTIHTAVPIFVAVMVWIIRVLIIGTFSVAGERMFTQGEARSRRPQSQRTVRPGELVPPPGDEHHIPSRAQTRNAARIELCLPWRTHLYTGLLWRTPGTNGQLRVCRAPCRQRKTGRTGCRS